MTDLEIALERTDGSTLMLPLTGLLWRSQPIGARCLGTVQEYGPVWPEPLTAMMAVRRRGFGPVGPEYVDLLLRLPDVLCVFGLHTHREEVCGWTPASGPEMLAATQTRSDTAT